MLVLVLLLVQLLLKMCPELSELMRAWLVLLVGTTISTRCRLKSTTSGRLPTLASLVRSQRTPGTSDRRSSTAVASAAVGCEWPCGCVAGIFIFPWGGDTADWYPLDGGAYVGLNVVLGPHLQPNATRAWMEIGKKIRAGQGQSLPTLGGEARSPREDVRAEAEEEEMPASLEEAHRMIRSLRAQLGNGA